MSSAVDVVQAWFDAHEQGDLDAARGLTDPRLVVYVSGVSDVSPDLAGASP